ncbi:hypothetical protein [Carboxylicivirga marina]|uniref:hypothetical protein n=1 Tax=Carboxylicivirga marina TaxID=2800988 RepID=UPI002597390F|nr:hypothetical protein [uncultured Carboxylicivirga sp.]
MSELKYEVYFKYDCDSSIKKATNYWFTVNINDSTYSYFPDSVGICNLPKADRYEIEYYSPRGTVRKSLLILDSRTDTIIIPPIYLSATNINAIGPAYYEYVNCGEICNGRYKTYRETGKLWQNGRFKRGKLRKLTTYYSNGKIESIKKNLLLSDCVTEYDKSEKLIMEFKFFLFYSKVKLYDPVADDYLKGIFWGHY